MSTAKKKVLVVEDDSALRWVIVKKLQKEGFTTIIATNGEEGLAVALDDKPDLILLDIVMPKMDGITMLYRLRQHKAGKDIPIIILTNLSDDKAVEESIRNNVFDYLIKSNYLLGDVVRLVKSKLNN